MHTIQSHSGVTVSYEKDGSGPPLVLIHGGFSDHHTNWEFVAPFLEENFTLHAIARRGRGRTDRTEGHTVEDETGDAVALIQAVGEPVFLLGHSYGAHVALAAAAAVPDKVRKLVLYEAPRANIMGPELLNALASHARAGNWDAFALTFFRDALFVPAEELEAMRPTPLWPPIIADARATLGDLHALRRYDFQAEAFRNLRIPVLLQYGSLSPRHLYVTDALAAALPDVQLGELEEQAHEGMTTAPKRYAEAVTAFLAPAQIRAHKPSATAFLKTSV